MARARCTPAKKVWLWRWRDTPLRRRSDRLEAWIVLTAWLFAVAGGLSVALVAGVSFEQSLAVRRAQVHPVTAVLTQDAPGAPALTTDGTSEGTVWAKVRWTAAEGTTHTGLAKAEPGSEAGTSVTAWVDRKGELRSQPPTAVEAQLYSVLVGTSAGLAAGATVLGCERLARAGLDRRRLREWDAEWARVGPQWRKRMSG
ncbi:hypothetical protein O3Q52_38950 [Streptomyces sp. ActVer]|uniref:Rv1733c family protein n=1 Tax=Streptomyces sp. ActVer TaxID=3014558 RepID=UPI0022B46B12|nr:hypothetical protein [Streptomyces sp. ActVer]MCZ4514015.1 hypothetical protein [Streptomyces sp. ActVer]